MSSQFEFDSLLFQRNNDPDKLDFDIIETILKIDPEFGKKFLLNSYYTQKGKYGWADDFVGNVFAELKLAQGLTFKSTLNGKKSYLAAKDLLRYFI